MLSTFAKHFQTQEPMPEDMMRRLCISKNLFSASETQLQVFYSALDQAYHAQPNNLKMNTTEVLQIIQEKYYSLPYVSNTVYSIFMIFKKISLSCCDYLIRLGN